MKVNKTKAHGTDQKIGYIDTYMNIRNPITPVIKSIYFIYSSSRNNNDEDLPVAVHLGSCLSLVICLDGKACQKGPRRRDGSCGRDGALRMGLLGLLSNLSYLKAKKRIIPTTYLLLPSYKIDSKPNRTYTDPDGLSIYIYPPIKPL